MFLFPPGFTVLHLLKLEELKREQANFRHGGTWFALSLCGCAHAGQHGGERCLHPFV